MLKLIVLLAVGGGIYTLGHTAGIQAATPAATPAQASAWSSVANNGAGWLASQMAVDAKPPAQTQPRPVAPLIAAAPERPALARAELGALRIEFIQ